MAVRAYVVGIPSVIFDAPSFLDHSVLIPLYESWMVISGLILQRSPFGASFPNGLPVSPLWATGRPQKSVV